MGWRTKRRLSLLAGLTLLMSLLPGLAGVSAGAAGPTVFINEIHYDNAGADTGEAFEIAGPAGTDLSGWSVVLYNGSTGVSYTTVNLSGTIPNQQAGFGTVRFLQAGIQNGSPDGLALIDSGSNVIEFLSYEGTFTANGGPANGLLSTDIGVSEASGSPVGNSLQLTGTGSMGGDFTWAASQPNTFGAVNTGQTFVGGGGGSPLVVTCTSDAIVAAGFADSVEISVTDADDKATWGTVDVVPSIPEITVSIQSVPDEIGQSAVAAINVSSAAPVGSYTVEATAGNTAGDPGSCAFEIEVVALTPIYEIQGAGHESPFRGDTVSTVGVVTAVDSNNFFFQDQTGDADFATSDGMNVFTGGSPSVAVGDLILAIDRVDEFQPGGSSTSNLKTTQMAFPTITVLSSGNPLPAPVIIGTGGRVPPNMVIDDDFAGPYDPVDGVFDAANDGIDFYESLEGMVVTVKDAVAVAGTNRFGETYVIADNTPVTGLSVRGTLNIAPDDFNPEWIQIQRDSTLSPVNISVDTGDMLGDVTGPVGYSFGNYEVLYTNVINVTPGGLSPETTSIVAGDTDLTIASYNVLNLDPNDDDGDTDVADGRFVAIAAQIVNALNSPDIIALQEVQDNSGSTNDGTTSASETLSLLIDEIEAAGGPTYQFVDNSFIGDLTSGGQPGANIRTAFLYNPDRAKFKKNSLNPVVDPADQQVNPDNPFFDARLPLAATFQFGSEKIHVVNNHFSSKGGSAELMGDVQPSTDLQEEVFVNGSLDERRDQAQAVADYIQTINPSVDGIVVLGDLNEFEFISPVQDILGAELTNLTNSVAPNERYSFVFRGNSQSLDHVLVSDPLVGLATFDIVHVNAEFAETSSRASDHDPLLVSLTLPNGSLNPGKGNKK